MDPGRKLGSFGCAICAVVNAILGISVYDLGPDCYQPFFFAAAAFTVGSVARFAIEVGQQSARRKRVRSLRPKE